MLGQSAGFGGPCSVWWSFGDFLWMGRHDNVIRKIQGWRIVIFGQGESVSHVLAEVVLPCEGRACPTGQKAMDQFSLGHIVCDYLPNVASFWKAEEDFISGFTNVALIGLVIERDLNHRLAQRLMASRSIQSGKGFAAFHLAMASRFASAST